MTTLCTSSVLNLPSVHVPLVDLRAQHDAIQDELDAAIRRVFESGQFILGDQVERFETEFAAYCGAPWAVGVGSGLAAIELALKALGIGPGDEVITAANTFVATALAIDNVGATPVLVDALESSFNLDPSRLNSAITSRTRAILPVHLYGQPADLDAILEIARAHHLAVVEDASQAHGATYRGRKVGTFGDAGCFSFYPTKNLGACGDAGMVVTHRQDVRDSIRRLRNYGQTVKYISEVPGHNERLDPLQAAILGVKLPRLDRWNDARRLHAARYDELLADLPLLRPRQAEDRRHVWHLYVVRTPARDALARFLAQRGVITASHYPVAIHRQPALARHYTSGERFPVAERLCDEVLSIPIFPDLRTEQIEHVAASIRAFFAR
jgi:dTDP-4-amino-4,6-dideoxygalactose transaminase